MLLTKEVDIRVNPNNINSLNNKGIDNIKINDIIKIETTLLNDWSQKKVKVRCDICGCEKEIAWRSYKRNVNKYNIYCCSNKCALIKNKNTNNTKYGEEFVSQVNKFKEKQMNTCIQKYGFSNPLNNEKIKLKRSKTMFDTYGFIYNFQNKEILKKAIQNSVTTRINEDVVEFENYTKKVRRLTKQNIKYMKWDGYDFYDGEYIKDNLNLHHLNKEYPTIDHKTSIKYGFDNNIKAEEISKLDNLCYTKRYINSSKRKLTEIQFKNKLVDNDVTKF